MCSPYGISCAYRYKLIFNSSQPKKCKAKEPENSGSFALHLRAEYLEDKACGNSGADDTGYVRAHSVHEQEVCRICLLALNLRNAGCHRNGRYTGRADQRVYLAAGQLIHNLAEQQAADGRERERDQAEDDDLDGLPGQEGGRNRLAAYRQSRGRW